MLAGRSLIRVLIDSGRSIYHPLYNVNITLNVSTRADRLTLPFTRCYAKDTKKLSETTKPDIDLTVSDKESMENLDIENKFDQDVLSKYKVFKDEDSPIILDVEEERLASQFVDTAAKRNEYDGISLERGTNGVFDIEELVSVLREQSALDIAVIEIPETLGYAEQMVIVSAKSSRHLLALATYVRILFKKKMHKEDRIPVVEGKRNKNEGWLALDLGNIILHVFSKSTRVEYDLESLWALGPEFDPHLNQPQDPLTAIINKHSHYLGDLQPADTIN